MHPACRRAAGVALLLGGGVAFAGLAGAALLGLHPFEPAWAFAACAAAMAGAALRSPVADMPGEGGGGELPSDGGGTGAGEGGHHAAEAGTDVGGGDGGESGGPD